MALTLALALGKRKVQERVKDEAITLEQVYVLARREITVGTDGECESKLGLVLSGLAGWLGIPKVFQMGEK